ncbi:hypothetical protein ACU4GR_05765 [Methylobacterium oryzae CBMB20]
MIRFLAAPAACLVLCGAAAAQDMPSLATLSPPDTVQAAAGPALPAPDGAAAPGARPEAGPDQAALRPEPGRTPLGGLTLRSTADTAQTTASLKAPATASKPWCAQERRVGTGQGFCLVN